jgi:hypothetical protein
MALALHLQACNQFSILDLLLLLGLDSTTTNTVSRPRQHVRETGRAIHLQATQ